MSKAQFPTTELARPEPRSARDTPRPVRRVPHSGFLAIFLKLTRARITVAVMLTTATGYFLGAGELNAQIWMPLLGLFLLSSGSSALNQCQESRIDAMMARTKGRPIPNGLIERSTALFVSVLLLLLGMSVLASVRTNTNLLLLLGGFAVLWYNGVYTYLKRRSAFAVIPGALIGAIPPVMGYVAAGGSLTSPLILLVGLFFFIWQIPHFWLLLLIYGGQYSDAGLPSLTRVFSQQQLSRITFMWVAATAAAGLVFSSMTHGDVGPPWNLTIVIASVWLAWKDVSVLQPPESLERKRLFRKTFMYVNVYALIVMICLSLNALGVATARAGG